MDDKPFEYEVIPCEKIMIFRSIRSIKNWNLQKGRVFSLTAFSNSFQPWLLLALFKTLFI